MIWPRGSLQMPLSDAPDHRSDWRRGEKYNPTSTCLAICKTLDKTSINCSGSNSFNNRKRKNMKQKKEPIVKDERTMDGKIAGELILHDLLYCPIQPFVKQVQYPGIRLLVAYLPRCSFWLPWGLMLLLRRIVQDYIRDVRKDSWLSRLGSGLSLLCWW